MEQVELLIYFVIGIALAAFSYLYGKYQYEKGYYKGRIDGYKNGADCEKKNVFGLLYSLKGKLDYKDIERFYGIERSEEMAEYAEKFIDTKEN